MLDLKQLRDVDPLMRMAEKQSEQEEFSPMDPPDAYAPPGGEEIPYEDLHPVIRHFIDEHKACIGAIDAFEGTLNDIQQKGLEPASNQGLGHFFRFLDEKVVRHNLKEEKILFPLLHERFLERGEHSGGTSSPRTAVDMLEDDHVKLMQLAAVAFNFFGLAVRLPDPASRALVLDAALEQAKTLVELLRLHIFREEHIVFPLAHRYATPDELDEMGRRLEAFA